METDKPTSSSFVFDAQRAENYDRRREKLAPIKDALHLLMGLVLSDLVTAQDTQAEPKPLRLLCVGAGTGAELLALAQSFPQMQFTVVEPAPAMLAQCRQKAQESGIESRCYFHEGYLNSLPDKGLHHGATSILVSHFITDPQQRTDYFRDIAERLIPGGCLISADLAADTTSRDYHALREIWKKSLQFAEVPEEDIQRNLDSHGNGVAVSPAADVASLIAAAGFEAPVQYYQCLLIHAWFARKSD